MATQSPTREGDEHLVAPLLASDDEDDDHSAAGGAVHAALQSVSPAAAHAAHAAVHAVSRFFAPRRFSLAAAQRRRSRRLRRLRSRVRSFRSSCESDASTGKGDVPPRTPRPFNHGVSFTSSLSDGAEDEGDVDEYASPSEESPTSTGTKAKAAGVGLVTVAGLASYLASFVGTATVYSAAASSAAVTMLGVAGGVLILIVPWVWLNEWGLVHMQVLRTQLDELRHEAKLFNRQVDILVMEEEELRDDTQKLRENNDRLEQRVMETTTGNIHDLVAQVQENQEILRQMKENVRRVVIQDVVKLIIRSDLSRNNTLNKYEADILAMRLTLTLNVYGIVFDVDKFHRAVGLSPSLGGVVTIVRRLIPDAKGRLSSFYDSADSSEEETDDGESDVYDMFHVHVDEEFHGKCLLVKGARAKLMSLAQSINIDQ